MLTPITLIFKVIFHLQYLDSVSYAATPAYSVGHPDHFCAEMTFDRREETFVFNRLPLPLLRRPFRFHHCHLRPTKMVQRKMAHKIVGTYFVRMSKIAQEKLIIPTVNRNDIDKRIPFHGDCIE